MAILLDDGLYSLVEGLVLQVGMMGRVTARLTSFLEMKKGMIS